MNNRNLWGPQNIQNHGRSRKLRKRLLLLLCACVFFICTALLISFAISNRQTAALQRELQEIHESATALPTETLPPSPTPTVPLRPTATPAAAPTPVPWYSRKYQKTDGQMLENMKTLRKKNRDIVAWIEAEDVFSLPVVFRDNTYYLNHDFNGKKNVSGTLFLDANTPFKANTQQLVIHGHNMKDGSMFAHLPHWRDKAYARKHPILHFSTLYREETYVIFAAMEVSTEPKDARFFNVSGFPAFASDEAFSAWLSRVAWLSLYPKNYDVTRDDALLALSTCIGEDRFIVLARRLREGETETEAKHNSGL